MDHIVLIIVGLLGLAIGSFLNVVICRLPRRQPVWRGRSVCPSCRAQLKWYHNIPVVSFLFLRGKCANCHEKISFQYPLVEVLNAAMYVSFAWLFGSTYTAAVYALLGSALLAVFFIDLEFQIIPDVITLPGIAAGILVSLLPDGIGPLAAAIGMLVGGGALYLISLLGDWLFKKESMGGGDIKMAAMLGAFLGWQKVVLVFVSSAVIGLLVSVVVLAVSARVRQTRVVPFGPFLASAALVAILYGDRLISFYVQTIIGRT